jgi:hypothetical protein
LAAHSNSCRLSFHAIVFDDVVFEAIAMTGHAKAFIAKEDPILVIRAHLIVLEEVVRVLVADRDSEPAVILKNVLLEQPVAHAPA